MTVTFRRSKAAEMVAGRYLTGIPKLLALCAILMEQQPLEDEIGSQNGLSNIEAGFLNSPAAASGSHCEQNSQDQESELGPRVACAFAFLHGQDHYAGRKSTFWG